MRSKTSYFNGTLFRKNLTRFWPLWGLTSFVGAMFPLAMLVEIIRRGNQNLHVQALDFTEAYYSVVADALPAVALVYALACAVTVWSYLFNARSVGAMHTLPIRREGLFLTGTLSGLAMCLIPFAVTGLLCIFISIGTGTFDAGPLLTTILAVLGEMVFYFGSATFVAFVTGNLVAMPLLYFLLHFLSMLARNFVGELGAMYIFGYRGGLESPVFFWLSPTENLYRLVETAGVRQEVERVSAYGERYTDFVTTDIQLQGAWVIGVYALAGLVLLGLAYAFYRRRRSESAGDVVAVGWLRPVFRYGLAALVGLLGGMLLYLLLWGAFQSSSYAMPIPMLVCILVAAAIGYYAASMLLARSLKVFRETWKGLIGVAVGCVVLIGVLATDALGISYRVPDQSRVAEVELRVAGNTYTLRAGEQDSLIAQTIALHQAIVQEQDYIRAVEDSPEIAYDTAADTRETGDEPPVNSTTEYLYLTYTFTDNSRMERAYDLTVTRDRMAQEGTFDNLLDRLVNSDEAKRLRLHLNGEGGWTLDDTYVNFQNTSSMDLTSSESQRVMDAVGRDLETGAWGVTDWFSDRDESRQLVISLEFSYSRRNASTDRWENDWANVYLWPEMTETIACLKDLGAVTDENLLTWAEYNAREESRTESYAPEGGEYSPGTTSVAVLG